MTAHASFSRRSLGKLFGTGLAAAAVKPLFAANTALPVRKPPGLVRLNSNENPYGPSPAALEAMREAFSLAWRYPDEAADDLAGDLAKQHEVSADSLLIGDGSSEILKLAASAYTAPGRRLVMAAPTFETIGAYARVRGAEVTSVPLDAAYAHDLDKMAIEGAGLVYLCNPNNPTASLTPKERVSAFLARLPASTMVLVDEAYHHYVENADYQSVIPLIKAHPNLIVARTFSKIYGMAGLRLGYAVANPQAVKKLNEQGAWDSVNIIALAAGRASLRDQAYVVEGRKRNAATRAQVGEELERLGYRLIPSHANFFMVDLRKEAKPVIGALRARGVQVGRLFPPLPRHLRVTVGKPEEMKRFLEAFTNVMA